MTANVALTDTFAGFKDKTNEVIDPQGMHFLQYNLYPTKVKVVSASVDSATVVPVDNGIIGNIQPNDFVTKR